MNVRKALFELEDLKYKEFSSKLTKTKYPIIGVRIPYIKKMAKEMKDESLSFFDTKYRFYFCNIFLQLEFSS